MALLTGNAGFIGSHVAELLLDEGWEVYALDDLMTASDANVFHLRVNPYLQLTVESDVLIAERQRAGADHEAAEAG